MQPDEAGWPLARKQGSPAVAMEIEARGILVRPLNDARLGPGFMRITTALPSGNARFVEVLRGLL